MKQLNKIDIARLQKLMLGYTEERNKNPLSIESLRKTQNDRISIIEDAGAFINVMNRIGHNDNITSAYFFSIWCSSLL